MSCFRGRAPAASQPLLPLVATSWVGCHTDANQSVLLDPTAQPIFPSTHLSPWDPGRPHCPTSPSQVPEFPCLPHLSLACLPDGLSADFRSGTRWRTVVPYLLLLKLSSKLNGSGPVISLPLLTRPRASTLMNKLLTHAHHRTVDSDRGRASTSPCLPGTFPACNQKLSQKNLPSRWSLSL